MKSRSFWNNFIKIQFLFLYFLLAYFIQSSFGEIVQINLYKKAEVSGKKILLGEISEVKCNEPKLLEKLKKLEISFSPALGRKVEIDLRKIKFQLRRADFDIDTFKFGKSSEVEVETKSMVLTGEQLFEKAKTFLMQKLEGKAEKLDLSLARVRDEKILLPFGELKLVPELPRSTKYKRVHLNVDIYIDDEKEQTTDLYVNVSGTYKVLVAKRNIERHKKIIIEKDLEEKKFVLDGIRELSVNTELLNNARARRFIRKGEIITDDKVEPIPIILSGSVVTIIAQIHSVTVSAIGKALEDGYAGKTIRVMNLRSNKYLECFVLSPNQVKVKILSLPQ